MFLRLTKAWWTVPAALLFLISGCDLQEDDPTLAYRVVVYDGSGVEISRGQFLFEYTDASVDITARAIQGTWSLDPPIYFGERTGPLLGATWKDGGIQISLDNDLHYGFELDGRFVRGSSGDFYGSLYWTSLGRTKKEWTLGAWIK